MSFQRLITALTNPRAVLSGRALRAGDTLDTNPTRSCVFTGLPLCGGEVVWAEGEPGEVSR